MSVYVCVCAWERERERERERKGERGRDWEWVNENIVSERVGERDRVGDSDWITAWDRLRVNEWNGKGIIFWDR